MSYLQYDVIRAKVSGNAELIEECKRLFRWYASCADKLDLAVDGSPKTVDELGDMASFDTIEATVDYMAGIPMVWNLVDKIEELGNDYGILLNRDTDFDSKIATAGKVTCSPIDLSACEEEWSTGVMTTVSIQLDKDNVCKLMGLDEDDTDDLEEELEEDTETLLVALFGQDLVDDIFSGETEPAEIDTDDWKLEFCPSNGWNFGTIDDFAERKETFERAATIMKGIGGTIDIYWEDVTDDPSLGNSFVSGHGFKAMKFKTSPNCWGDFEAVEYELK